MMDTAVTIKVFLPDSTGEPQAATAIAAVFAELERLDSLMSSYRADSEVAAINRAAGANNTGNASQANEIGISTDVDSVIRAAQYVSACTEGAFDITIAPVLRLWGFGTDSLAVPSRNAITSRLPLVNFRHLRLRRKSAVPSHASPDSLNQNLATISFEQPGMAIDLGGIAKGYAADVAARMLAQRGYDDVLIAVGGDLRMTATALTAGKRYIWIKHPRQPDKFFARFRLDRGAVSTSGDYERYFERDGKRYHHILDPRSGFPAGENPDGTQIVSVTVVSHCTILSDGFETPIFVMGLERGLALAESLPGLEAVMVYLVNGKLEWRATRGLKEKLEIIATEI